MSDIAALRQLIESGRVSAKLSVRSKSKTAVRVLQRSLYRLGYGMHLRWADFGADGDFGLATARAVRAFGASYGVATDGDKVNADVAEHLISRLERLPFAKRPPANLDRAPSVPPETARPVVAPLRVTTGKTRTTVSDGVRTRSFRKFRRGYYTVGGVKTSEVIAQHREQLLAGGMSQSALNILQGVSRNEGNLDAVNTWDNAFLSFGMFQWTAGTGNARGELAALLRRIDQISPEAFARNFAPHGIGYSADTSATHGLLTLNGRLLQTKSSKEQLRRPEWCFRFWSAGQDTWIQKASLHHAYGRIAQFSRSPQYRIHGWDVADVVTSEYGMALLLDHHVNRPGHVAAVLRRAVTDVGLQKADPATWTSSQEQQVLRRYLRVRETFGRWPMTDAAIRARRTRSAVTKGVLSDRRGSFRI